MIAGLDPQQLTDVISKYGFPIVSSVLLLYFVYYIWKYITEKIETTLKESSTTLVALIDRIRMLDNDIIRLQQKLDTVITLRDVEKLREKAHGTTKENMHKHNKDEQ